MTYEEMAIKQQELMARKEDLFNKIEENLDKAESMYKFLIDPHNEACCELWCHILGLTSGKNFSYDDIVC